MRTYVPSGHLPWSAVPLGVLGGCAAGVVLGWPYQLLLDRTTFVYVSLLATVALGAAIGLAAGHAMRLAHCRSPAASAAVAALCAAVAVGVTHYYSYDRRRTEAAELMARLARDDAGATEAFRTGLAEWGIDNADEVIEGVHEKFTEEAFRAWFTPARYLDVRRRAGWNIAGRLGSGLPLTGFLVWVVWLVELGLVGGAAWLLARGPVSQPYCETCGQWARAEELVRVETVDDRELSRAAKAGDLGSILLPERREGGRKTAHYTVHRCAGKNRTCDARWLTVKLKWQPRGGRGRRGAGGKAETQDKTVVEHATTTAAQIAALETHLEMG